MRRTAPGLLPCLAGAAAGPAIGASALFAVLDYAAPIGPSVAWRPWSPKARKALNIG